MKMPKTVQRKVLSSTVRQLEDATQRLEHDI